MDKESQTRFNNSLAIAPRKYPTHIFDNDTFRIKYPSEPNLSSRCNSPGKLLDSERFVINSLNEILSVDQLGYYRRKKPPDLHTKSNIDLREFSADPQIPFDQVKSEYENNFKSPGISPRRDLIRRSTSLKFYDFSSEPKIPYNQIKSEYEKKFTLPISPALTPHRDLIKRSTSLKEEVVKEKTTEQRSQFKAYKENEFHPSSKIKYPENLFVSGDIDFLPEYKRAYKNFRFQMNQLNQEPAHDPFKPSKKVIQQQSNLRLEGSQFHSPEYKSQFKEHNRIDKSVKVPQVSHIKFHGNFSGIAEYSDRYRYPNQNSKSKPIRKNDNLKFADLNKTVPEYRDRYNKGYDQQNFQRVFPIIKNDTLNMKGEFTKDRPEYYESFKDPHIKNIPERAKCRKTYLDLSGTTEFHPEYKSTYLDFPRSRPITKKQHASIKFSPDDMANQNDEDLIDRRPSKRFLQQSSTIKFNIHEPPSVESESLAPPPEIRKAQMDLLRREKPFHRRREIFHKMSSLPRKMEHYDSLESTTPANTATEDEHEDDSAPEIKNSAEDKIRNQRLKGCKPSFKLTVENVDEGKGKFKLEKRRSPRFGRRAGRSQDDHNLKSHSNSLRNSTRVIEGNRKYVKDTERFIKEREKDHLDMAPSFVILDDPPLIKGNTWMTNNQWYDR